MTMKPIEKIYYAVTILSFLLVGQLGIKVEQPLIGIILFNWAVGVILFLIRTIRM